MLRAMSKQASMAEQGIQDNVGKLSLGQFMGTFDDSTGMLGAQSKNRTYCLFNPASSFYSQGNQDKDSQGVAQCHSELVADVKLEFCPPDTQTST